MGIDKHITVDKAKLKEAIQIGDSTVDEIPSTSQRKIVCEEIMKEGMSEEDFLKQIAEQIGTPKLIGG